MRSWSSCGNRSNDYDDDKNNKNNKKNKDSKPILIIILPCAKYCGKSKKK